MRVIFAAMWAAFVLCGCADPGVNLPAPGGAATKPEEHAAPVEARRVPPPTRADGRSSATMRYFYWEPGAEVADFGEDARARAEAVLASPSIRELLGADAEDGFVFQKFDEARQMVTFRQTRAFRGQQVVVAEAFATVELAGGTALVYLGTGFRSGISLSDAPLTIDEARAKELAVAAYEKQEGGKAVATEHLDPGLRVAMVAWRGDRLVFPIHVEGVADGGFTRPWMLYIDAQSGDVVKRYQAWIE